MSDGAASGEGTKREESHAPEGNILAHIKTLEASKAELQNEKAALEQQLRQADARADRLSVKTREGMQAAMDTLNHLAVESIEEAVAFWRKDDPDRPIRVASEYASLADEYARSRHLRQYRVIPISGASEGFVPEDAEILIEGTETGSTLRANRLRMIDVIMESTNCVIGAATRPSGRRGELRDRFVERLIAASAAVE